ncbi:MAG TPA: hypothetical protein VMP68_32925 [Candidatus Eisenbacteria bacterium]|nr:hypothetical protein [Candidatus Eisenbacteria bacterium]
MNKYCRICWNTRNWRQPSNDARLREAGTSFVADNGFGHEEWLFNFSWVLRGYNKNDPQPYRYGFLRPIGRFRKHFAGQTFAVLLYTVAPNGARLIVARIDDLYVPQEDELSWALNKTIKNGWLASMRKDLDALTLDSSPLINPHPWWVANVRFEQRKVLFYDPRPRVQGKHKINRTNRYTPLDWNETFPPVSRVLPGAMPPRNHESADDPTRRENERIRAAIEATTYDPRHVQLQNRLYRRLCKTHGKSVVGYERDFIDLTITTGGTATYIEIKTELTAKRCIRIALGQLLEYSNYPSGSRATRLLVVGDAFPAPDDVEYLRYLRDQHRLPIYYARWDWDADNLDQEV